MIKKLLIVLAILLCIFEIIVIGIPMFLENDNFIKSFGLIFMICILCILFFLIKKLIQKEKYINKYKN